MQRRSLAERLAAARRRRGSASPWKNRMDASPYPDETTTKQQFKNKNKSLIDAGSFKTPSIPPVDSFYDVKLTRVANPEDFIVQPLATAEELKKLMADLQKICNSYTGPPLKLSSIKAGNSYAVKWDDTWYRACISKIVGKRTFVVYFCDYGFYKPVSYDMIQPLGNQFFNLPYQAIRAKLHDVKPISEEGWTIADNQRFDELGRNECFLSIVKSCNMDNLLSKEPVLGLDLIYTSTAFDVSFKDFLTWEKRSV